MRFGVCTATDKLDIVERVGADYIDCTVTEINNLSDMALLDFVDKLDKSRIRCEALAVLFPGNAIPLTGTQVNINEIKAYLEQTFKRLHRLQPSIVVFGSGAARMCLDGFNRRDAQNQLTEVCRMIAKAAKPYDITIALEPLNKSETNMINTLAEGLEMVKRVDMPNFRLLADIFHMLMDDEPADAIRSCKDVLVHTHIAAKIGRACPAQGDKALFAEYMQVLRDIGYAGRMSVEASFADLERQLPEAFDLLRSY